MARLIPEVNDLQTKKPELAKQWHPTKNGERNPRYVTVHCNDLAWWLCPVCGYEWEAKISNRSNGRGCPCCAGKVVVAGKNDLATTHPQLAREWDSDKNFPVTPKDVSYGNGKKFFWKCPNRHSYKATINHRSGKNGTGCPICNAGRQTSFAEQAVYYYVKKVFPDAINRYRDIFENSMELDIYIPSLRLGIEYDGIAWHKEDKIEKDRKKYEICKQNKIRLLRLQENYDADITDLADEKLSIKGNMYEHDNLEKVIRLLLDDIDPESNMWTRKHFNHIHSDVDINIKRDESEIRSYMTVLRKDSLGEKYPHLVSEWHPEKNGNVTPFMVKPGSDIKAWWICQDCGHEYFAIIGKRAKDGTGCPKCGIKKNTKKRSKPVNMINLSTGEIIRTFDSIAQASREMKISDGNIGTVCKNNGRSQAGGYGWKYADNPDII